MKHKELIGHTKRLEQGNLSSYLPFDLKMINEERDVFNLVGIETVFCLLKNDELTVSTPFKKGEFKPILRPLSDLTKEIEHNGDIIYTVKHMSMYSRQQTNDFTNGLEWAIIKTFPYSDFEYLFKMHFDVFGLINKGLAIDINTLNR